MSYRIEYQWACFVIDEGMVEGLAEPRFAIAIEGGDNNLTEVGRDGRERRVRTWEIGMIGTHRQVLRQATRFASACEGAMLRPRGRCCTPEAYIRRIRGLMREPQDRSRTLGHLALAARFPAKHAVASGAKEPGFTYYPETSFGQEFVKLIPLWKENWARYFELIDPYLDDFSLAPWSAGQVHAMPRS